MGGVPGFVKWGVAPAVAVVLGYFVIGPQTAGKVKIPEAVAEGLDKVAAPLAPKKTPSPPPTAPEVTVGVKPVDPEAPKDDVPKPRRRRRRRRETTPEDQATPDRVEP